VSEQKKNQATLLVEIAQDLYVLGCATDGGSTAEPFTFAAPKNAPDKRLPLADIRKDIAAMYSATYFSVPNASALGDAMTVLEGLARKTAPIKGDKSLLALLAGGGNIADRLVDLAQERFSFGVTTTGEVFAVATDGPNIARPLRGGRRSLRSELARLFHEEDNGVANSSALADALLVLEGEAQHGSDPVEVALRVGRAADGRLVLDLGTDDGRAVVIGSAGWEIVDSSPVLFWRTNAALPLPVPNYGCDGGDLDGLRNLLNVAEADWPLIVAWLVAALVPELPHPVLLLRGEHGTAKSSAARLLTSLLDRSASQLRTAPGNVEDWCVAAAGGWITCLDNVSRLQDWLQDAVCRAVTGDGLLRRALYTDSDVTVLAFRRVVALTSVDPGRLNGDLADRLLVVELERIPESDRAAEEDLEDAWAKAHPAVLGGLLDLAVRVLQVLPTVRRSGLPRMADFARIVLAVDQVLGMNAFLTYSAQSTRTAEAVAEGDPVTIAIRDRITEPWGGTASDLLKLLTPDKPDREWPRTPQGMGGRLSRAAPSLRALGWQVDQLPRTRGGRRWAIAPPAAEGVPGTTSPSSPMSPTPSDLGFPGDDWGDDTCGGSGPDVTAGDVGDDPGGPW